MSGALSASLKSKSVGLGDGVTLLNSTRSKNPDGDEVISLPAQIKAQSKIMAQLREFAGVDWSGFVTPSMADQAEDTWKQRRRRNTLGLLEFKHKAKTTISEQKTEIDDKTSEIKDLKRELTRLRRFSTEQVYTEMQRNITLLRQANVAKGQS